MPELPEVETVRRGLEPAMAGARLIAIEQRRPDLRFPFPERFVERLTGRRVEALRRRAKYLIVDLDGAELLVMHLGMSGSFRIEQADGMGARTPVLDHDDFGLDQSKIMNVIDSKNLGRDAGGKPVSTFPHPALGAGPKNSVHDHVAFELSTGVRIVYNDPRRFGFMQLIPRLEFAAHPLFKNIGMEPLGDEFDGAALARLFAGRTAPLKAALLDQSLIAGLGNIYVCEALHRAGLSPLRTAASLARKDGSPGRRAHVLAQMIREVLEEAVAAGGSSLRDHRRTDGALGYFQHSFRVYGREHEPCARCGGAVRRITQSGRATFFCGGCQR